MNVKTKSWYENYFKETQKDLDLVDHYCELSEKAKRLYNKTKGKRNPICKIINAYANGTNRRICDRGYKIGIERLASLSKEMKILFDYSDQLK